MLPFGLVQENGGTHIIPGSHLWGEDRFPEPNNDKQGIRFVAPAGSVCLFVSTAWHGAGANYSKKPRMAVACVYGEPFIRPYENQFLISSPSDIVKMPKKLQSLLGYSVGTPLVGRVNGSHPLKALQVNPDGSATIKYVTRKEVDSARL